MFCNNNSKDFNLVSSVRSLHATKLSCADVKFVFHGIFTSKSPTSLFPEIKGINDHFPAMVQVIDRVNCNDICREIVREIFISR